MGEYKLIILFIYLLLLIPFGLLSWALKGFWVKFYYKSGLPIYRRKLLCTRKLSNPDLIAKIDNHLKALSLPFAIKEFDEQTIAFRENYKIQMPAGKSKQMMYTPIMHGLIKFDRVTGNLTVSGLTNSFQVYFFLGFIFFAIAIFGSFEFPFILMKVFFLGFIAIVAGSIYTLQKKVYDKIVEFLSEELKGISQ